MARPLRFEYKGALYHVHARGNERRKIFFTDADYKKFKEYVAGAIVFIGDSDLFFWSAAFHSL
jgi:REP element-mobilizing transposase RayT